MVSHGQGNNRPQARLSETGQGQSQWIQQIMKHGEKYVASAPALLLYMSSVGLFHMRLFLFAVTKIKAQILQIP